MFKIGEFSKLAQVSIRMLRYYDEVNLLKPEEVDQWTGYLLNWNQNISRLCKHLKDLATLRSPMRPNPIALTASEIINIDYEHGIIHITFIDAYDGTPVLDIKPYTPSLDRVENPSVPAWCSYWPKSTEESGDFDWEKVFNF